MATQAALMDKFMLLYLFCVKGKQVMDTQRNLSTASKFQLLSVAAWTPESPYRDK